MQPLITIVTPITGGPEPRENLRAWVDIIGDLPIKLILIHDERDPETRKEVSEIAELRPSNMIKVVHGNFGSPGAARNAGLKLVDTEWVIFWDSDDIGDPQNLVRTIKENPEAEAIIFAFTKNSDLNRSKSELITLSTKRNLYLQMANQGGLWRYAIKKKSIKNLEFSRNMMGEDQLFLIELDLTHLKLVKTNSVVYSYFYGSDRHLTSDRNIQSQVKVTLNALVEYLEKQNRRFYLFESAVYFKLLISVCKYSPLLDKISSTYQFFSLVLVKRKVSSGHVIRIIINLAAEYKEKFRANR